MGADIAETGTETEAEVQDDDVERTWEESLARAEEAVGGDSEGEDDSEESDGDSKKDTDDDSEDEDSEGDDGDDSENPPKKSLQDARTKPKQEGSDEERQQLKDLAKKLGYDLEDSAILPKDHVKFRQERRAFKEKFESQQQQYQQQLEQITANLEAKYGGMEKAQSELRSGNFDEFAKQVGFSDFGDMARKYATGQSVESIRIAELEKKTQQQEAFRQQQAQRYQQQQQQQQEQEQVQQYFNHMATRLHGYAETQELATDPQFLQDVFTLQEQHIDPDTNRYAVSIEDAAATVLDTYRQRYGKVSGNKSPGAAPEGGADEPPSNSVESAQKKRTPKTVSQKQATGALGETATDVDPDSPEWMAFWAKKIQASHS